MAKAPERYPGVQDLRDLVEREAAWSRGIVHPWEGDALLDPDFLSDLVEVASHAPLAYRKALMARYGDPDVES